MYISEASVQKHRRRAAVKQTGKFSSFKVVDMYKHMFFVGVLTAVVQCAIASAGDFGYNKNSGRCIICSIMIINNTNDYKHL